MGICERLRQEGRLEALKESGLEAWKESWKEGWKEGWLEGWKIGRKEERKRCMNQFVTSFLTGTSLSITEIADLVKVPLEFVCEVEAELKGGLVNGSTADFPLQHNN